jgi:hypothetical protein
VEEELMTVHHGPIPTQLASYYQPDYQGQYDYWRENLVKLDWAPILTKPVNASFPDPSPVALRLQALQARVQAQEALTEAARALVKAKTSAKGKPEWDEQGRLLRGGNWTQKELALYKALEAYDQVSL